MKYQHFGMRMLSAFAMISQPVLAQEITENNTTEAYAFMASVVGDLSCFILLVYIGISVFLVVLEPADPKDKTKAFMLFGAPIMCGIISTIVGIACQYWSPMLTLNLVVGFLLSFLNFLLFRKPKAKN